MNNPLVHKGTSTTPKSGCSSRWDKAAVTASVMVSSLFLSGCSTMLCVGTGTCSDLPMTYSRPQQPGQFTPQTVLVNGQPVIVIPEYSSQRTQTILIPGK